MTTKRKPKLVVGIGASAGGLGVLKELVKTLPSQGGMAFIVVQHLDPTHPSMLSEILRRESSIPVEDAANNKKLLAGHIYVIPPDTYLELAGHEIKLIKPQHTRGSRREIDHFFRSLAEVFGDKCVGIVLSGAGDDGTAGLRAIKGAGGLTLAQDPSTAEHRSMPLAAIEGGVVDKVVNVEEISDVLEEYVNHPLTLLEMDKPGKQSPGSLEEITAILKTHDDFNLRQYKLSTVHRRIARRMSLIGVKKHEEYVRILRESKEERANLTKDLLINVTDFFRDQDAFLFLENNVIPDLLNKIKDDNDIRVWVVGCASGEEAYSIAILLLEALAKSRRRNEVKIFATDIDEDAIQVARKGIYPASIASEIPRDYLEKYFNKLEDTEQYKVVNSVRDIVSFANQNVAAHPPFSHTHLISCRNVLIYFKKEVQEKILNSFYFSLENDMYLFLGSSESVGHKTNAFSPLSKKWRIFRKVPGQEEGRGLVHDFHPQRTGTYTHEGISGKELGSRARRVSLGRSDEIRRSMLDVVVPAMMVVDRDGRVLYNHGKLKPYVIVPAGEPRNDIMQMILPSIRSRLRSGLYKVRKGKESLSFNCVIPLEEDKKKTRTIKIDLFPLDNPSIGGGDAVGIAFSEITKRVPKTKLTTEDESRASQNLERELVETKEELQNTIEELETSTEELKSAHEEALSANEELQSANEELEASAEELRSLNEELSTVNAELRDKIIQLQKATNDVQNFFSSTNLPTIFLNPDLEIQRYTPAAEQLLKMGPQDVGRPIHSLGRDLVDNDLTSDCKEVLQTFLPVKKEIRSFSGRWYIRHISPYRTEDRRIEGIVLVFQDVTDLKELSKRAELRERQQAVIARLGMMALTTIDPEELMHHAVTQVAHVLDANFCKVLRYMPEQHCLKLVAGVGWRDGLVGKATVTSDKGSQAGYTLMVREPVIVKKLAEEKRFSGPDLLLTHHVVSGMSCVINHSDPPFGVLGVHTKEYREFTAEDANFLVAVATLLSTAIRSKDAQDKIYNSEEQFRTIANSIPQLAWMTDNTGYIFWYNQRWYDYTGTTFDEMKGWGWQKVHHPEHVERVTLRFKKRIELREEWEDTFPLRGQDGKYRWFLSRAKPIRNKSGTVIHWFGTNTDITEQLELEFSLKQAVSKLEETDKRKNEFLAILGHELRNPLGTLRGSTEILEMGLGEPEKIIGMMNRSIGTMGKLLDDLLDFSRVSRNAISLDLTDLNLSDILKSKVDEMRKQCATKSQELYATIDDDLYIKGDATRVEQIFSNLLSNASKFTHQGGNIRVTAKHNGDNIVVSVKDSGIGIREDEMDKIFDPFYQVTPVGQASAGLGIGLSLVKNLVELHDGHIRVSSNGKEQGTLFAVTFPGNGKEKPIAGLDKKDANLAIPPGLTIVLIDDNEDILFAFSSLLIALKCTVYTANTATKGLSLISDNKPDVAIVDIGLPDKSGYEVANTARSEGFDNILIAASGYSHEEAREKSQRAGFNYHLSKPVALKDVADILSKVERN